ncbi:hypothetical protein C0J52_26993 [Blattella germanica]|nr:hypothetical protein C0J52_26993 [Blattella germanica]
MTPTSWIPAKVETTHLIIDEDGDHEWDSWQPPHKPEKRMLMFNLLAQETDTRNLSLPHPLVNNGISSCFANDQISPLHNHNGGEESRMAGVLQLLSVTPDQADILGRRAYEETTVSTVVYSET